MSATYLRTYCLIESGSSVVWETQLMTSSIDRLCSVAILGEMGDGAEEMGESVEAGLGPDASVDNGEPEISR